MSKNSNKFNHRQHNANAQHDDVPEVQIQGAETPKQDGQDNGDVTQRQPLGFKTVNQKVADDQASKAVVITPKNVHDALRGKLGIEVDALADNSFIATLIRDLDVYVERMHPRTPVTPAQMLEQQNVLVRRLNDSLLQPPEVGVPALQVIEEYFRQHSRGALGGIHPFRSFNELPPRLQKYQDIIYAIQLVANEGKHRAMELISVTRLKESCPNPEAQLVLLGYLNS